MERHQLEDRIRASLQVRADDVEPTPELWERVADRTARRSRWLLGLWALSGAAVVVAVVFGGMALFGAPRNVEIQPEPDVVDTPDLPQPTPTDTTPGPAPASAPTLVTTDGQLLYELDPTTGDVLRQMDPYAGFAEGGRAVELAVRPVDEAAGLTIATVIEREGVFDIEVTVFDAEGQRTDREPIGMAVPATEVPPEIVWSQDGRYLMWAGASSLGGGTADPALWAYDWVDRPVTDNGQAEPVMVTAPGADSALFEGGGTVDLREWTGAPDDRSRVVATTTAGSAFLVDLDHVASDCADAIPCPPPTWQAQISELVFEGASPIDLGTLANGVNLALVVPTAEPTPPDGDADDTTLALLAEPMSDSQRSLQTPVLTRGTASPTDAWMAVADDRIAIGLGGQQAHLLTVTGDTVEELEVTGTVPLPDGTRAAAMTAAAVDADAPAEEATPASPTEGPTELPADQDGVPTHVLTGGPDELRLVDRRSPDEPLVTIPRPDGTDHEMAAGEVVVHPQSTPAHLQFVTTWMAGESQVLARTVVRDGEVVANEVLDGQAQPDNTGGAAETAHSAPVFSPDGRWLAWVETPDGGAGPAQVRIVDWTDQGAAGPGRAVTAPGGDRRPFQLLDWATTPEVDVLTMTPPAGPGADAPVDAAMIELRLQIVDGTIAESTDEDWQDVDLPGVLFDAGSFQFEDGAERYIAFDGGDQVLYGLAEAPGTAVETGAYAFSEGRVVAFGPDSALVQRPDGRWQRVQVDTGAASPVDMPAGTRTVLPWRG